MDKASRVYPNGLRLMTLGEAATYLRTSPQTLKSWPITPRRRPDGRAFYDIRDLDSFADNLPYDGENGETHGATGWEDIEA